MIGKYFIGDVSAHYYRGKSNNFICELYSRDRDDLVAFMEYHFPSGTITTVNTYMVPGDFLRLTMDFLSDVTDPHFVKTHDYGPRIFTVETGDLFDYDETVEFSA